MGQRISVTCCSSFRSILSRFCENLDLLRCRLEQTFYGKQHELCSSIAINVNFIFIVFTHSNTRRTNLNLNHQQPVSCKHVDCFVQNYRFEIITHTHRMAGWMELPFLFVFAFHTSFRFYSSSIFHLTVYLHIGSTSAAAAASIDVVWKMFTGANWSIKWSVTRGKLHSNANENENDLVFTMFEITPFNRKSAQPIFQQVINVSW